MKTKNSALNIKKRKITILPTAILLAASLGFSQSTFASSSNSEKTVNVKANVSEINKIEVRGNVELYLSEGAADQVVTYSNSRNSNSFGPDKNGVLRIASYQTQKLIVWVTASQLANLEVYDNADVRSFGKLSGIELNVKMYNNATAELNLDAYQANVTLNGHAKAALTGDIDSVDLMYGHSSQVDTSNLVAAHLNRTVSFDGIASSGL
jgi:hypothetical protein